MGFIEIRLCQLKTAGQSAVYHYTVNDQLEGVFHISTLCKLVECSHFKKLFAYNKLVCIANISIAYNNIDWLKYLEFGVYKVNY